MMWLCRQILGIAFLICLAEGSSEYYEDAEEFWGDYDSGDSRPVTKTWIWGNSFPRSSFDVRDLADQYPLHGLIQLSTNGHWLQINLVKRPPAALYPAEQSFCGSLLPVAIAQFMHENDISISSIRELRVSVQSQYTYMRACVCYVKVMLDMGFQYINKIPLYHEGIADFCASENHVEIVADFGNKTSSWAYSSPKSHDANSIATLSGAKYITPSE